MPTQRKDTRYYSLDFWRGVACLSITLFHSAYYVTANPACEQSGMVASFIFRCINELWMGVPLFFVISGYCIVAACDSARARHQSAGTYFLRRFRRIYPPFWIAFLLVALLVTLGSRAGLEKVYGDAIYPVPHPGSLSWAQWAGNLTLTESWRANVTGDPTRYFLAQSWSLCYEEQFYAVCGLLLVVARRRFFQALAGVTALVVLIKLVHSGFHQLPIAGFFFDGRWFLFAAGIWVYYRTQCGPVRFARWIEAGLLAAACLAIIVRIVHKSELAEEFAGGLIFAVVLGALHKRDIAIATHPWLRPITWCGTMCYSFYLVHWPAVKITSHLMYLAGIRGAWPTFTVVIPVSVAAAIGLAWVFHILVERRFLNTPPVLLRRDPLQSTDPVGSLERTGPVAEAK